MEPDGRITDNDLGLWSDEQIAPLAKIVEACHQYGAKVGIQIGHAGRKAQDAKQPVAPSPIPLMTMQNTKGINEGRNQRNRPQIWRICPPRCPGRF